MKTAIAQIVAVARRDLVIELSYKMRLLIFFSGPLGAIFTSFYVAKLVGSPRALASYEGDYFEYVVIGLALTSFASLGVAVFTARVIREQTAGTLEVLLAGSTRLPVLLTGGFVVPLLFAIVQMLVFILLGIGLVGVGVSASRLLVALPVVLLTMLSFCAIGIVAGGLTLLMKRGDPFTPIVYQITLLFSGAMFPVEFFPRWLQIFSWCLPPTYGVRGLREALLTDDGLAGVADELAVLAGFTIVLVPLSVLAFGAAVQQAKRYGVLSSY